MHYNFLKSNLKILKTKLPTECVNVKGLLLMYKIVIWNKNVEVLQLYFKWSALFLFYFQNFKE